MLANDLDRMDAFVQSLIYRDRRNNPRAFDGFIDDVRKKIKNPTLRKIAERMNTMNFADSDPYKTYFAYLEKNGADE